MVEHSQIERPEEGRILIVDDSPVMQLLLKSLLKKAGYTPFVVGLGAEAYPMAKKQRPHLILLDVMLPDLSGYEVCKILKENDDTKDIPVVFVTSLVDADECIKGLQLGALDFVSKPIQKKILLIKVATFVHLCRDDRLLKTMHDELKQSASSLKQFLQALDNASDAVVITNPDGEITYYNSLFKSLVRYSPKTKADQKIFAYFKDEESFSHDFSEVLAGVPSKIDTVLERDATQVAVRMKCSRILDEDGIANGLMFLIVDRTARNKADAERKRLETDLYQAQKLESVGELAAGIAHEINTPIQFVGDNLHFMQDSVQSLFSLQQVQNTLLNTVKQGALDSAVTDAVDQALELADIEYLQEELPLAISQSIEGVGRVSSIVRAMKDFAHPGSTEKTPVDLNKAIQTTITVAGNKWKYVATLVTEFDESLPLVPCLVSAFNQVVLNLIVNASDAIGDCVGSTGDKGEIRISTRCVENYVEVRVQDTGGGIPKKIQSRIFDPFFTTKEQGKGSGQGLAIGRGIIVNKHKGKFLFETEEGTGTTFIIQLPVESEN